MLAGTTSTGSTTILGSSREPVTFPAPQSEMLIGGYGFLISSLFMEDCWRTFIVELL